MKSIGTFFLVAVLTFGAFTSIDNVSAQVPEEVESKMMKASGTYQPKYGSHQNKVCGLELCNSKSVPNLDLTPEVKEVIKESAPQNLALEKALQGGVASEILANYHAYKEVNNSVIEQFEELEQEEIVSDFNNFANPDFLNSKTQSTLMRLSDQALDRSYVLPEWVKDYSNPDHHQYVPKEKPVSILVPEEPVEIQPEIFTEQADIPTLIGLTGLSQEDLEFFNLGVCGTGTVWSNGMCILADSVPANTDWAEYWSTNTKDETDIVLTDDVNMTDGVESIPLDGEPESQPIEETATPEIVMETLTVVNGTNNEP